MARTRLVLLALLLPFLGAACSSGDEEDSAESVADETTGGDVVEEQGDGSGAGADGGGTGTVSLVQLGRSVVRTAELSLVVVDVAAAAGEAVRIAEAAGGFQSAGSIDLAGEQPAGEVVLRVPASAFGSTLEALAELGDVADQRVGSEDVTGQVVDLQARIAAARLSVERVRGFLDRTGNVTELATVERELLTRESELEALLAQQAGLRDRVDLATVTARFGEDEQEPPSLSSDPQPSDDIPAPTRALRHGWVVLLNVLKASAAAVAFVAPFSLVVVPALVGWRVVQRRARRLAG
jgi:hypothetical protein